MDPKIKFIIYWSVVLFMVGIAVIVLILTGTAAEISFSVPLAVGIIFTISAAVWNEFLKEKQIEEKKMVYYQPAPLKKLKKPDEIENDSKIFEKSVFNSSWFYYIGQFFLSIIFLILVSVFFNKEFLVPGYFLLEFIGSLFSVPGYSILEYIGYFLIFAAVITLLNAVLKKFSHAFTITPNVVRSKTGIFSIKEKEIRISNIREVVVKQSIFQRIFGIGSVFFSSAGKGGIKVVFEGVENPMAIKKQVNEIRGYIDE